MREVSKFLFFAATKNRETPLPFPLPTTASHGEGDDCALEGAACIGGVSAVGRSCEIEFQIFSFAFVVSNQGGRPEEPLRAVAPCSGKLRLIAPYSGFFWKFFCGGGLCHFPKLGDTRCAKVSLVAQFWRG